MATLRAPETKILDWDKAARCALFDLCKVLGEAQVSELLGDGWAGAVLRRMQEHHEAVSRERGVTAKYESPESVQARREEKKRLKQERHQQRLAEKVLRDAEWRARQEKSR
jgi:hypothetical protein